MVLPLDAASHTLGQGAAARRRLNPGSSVQLLDAASHNRGRVPLLDAASHILGQGAAARRRLAHPRSGCCGATPPRTPSVRVLPLDAAS
jgi:hypothetical protein